MNCCDYENCRACSAEEGHCCCKPFNVQDLGSISSTRGYGDRSTAKPEDLCSLSCSLSRSGAGGTMPRHLSMPYVLGQYWGYYPPSDSFSFRRRGHFMAICAFNRTYATSICFVLHRLISVRKLLQWLTCSAPLLNFPCARRLFGKIRQRQDALQESQQGTLFNRQSCSNAGR